MTPSLRGLFVLIALVLSVSAAPEPPQFKCPTYIDTVVPSGQDRLHGKREPGDPFLATMRDVHNTLSNCSTIKSLKLRATRMGCEGPDRWSLPLDFPSGSRYPSQLEALDLDGYHFNDSAWEELRKFPHHPWSELMARLEWLLTSKRWRWLMLLPLSAEVKAKTNLQLWLEAMDFSHIKQLVLRSARGDAPDAATLIPHLKSLQSLTVYGAWARDFILGLPKDSLAHLAWIDSEETGGSVQGVLRRHAGSLRSLEWREPESGFRERRVMTAEQIAELGRAAPNLNKITLDMNRNSTWPMEHLEALATSFPKVTNVTIFWEIASECRRQLEGSRQELGMFGAYAAEQASNCKGLASMAQPLLVLSEAIGLFDLLRERKVGEALTKAVFYAGDWGRAWDGVVAADLWLDGRRSFYLCEAVEGVTRTKRSYCRGIYTKIASPGSRSGWYDDHGPLDEAAWEDDLAQRAIRMEL